ncbi:hypothetical protein ACFLSY_05330 [Bacteroidota bacterium]
MYCLECNCEFSDWVTRCPDCNTILVSQPIVVPVIKNNSGDYKKLISKIKENNGKLDIELLANDIGIEKKTTFPGFGFGFAWTKKMHGETDDIIVDLSTISVSSRRKWSFPYFGFGFTWEKIMHGSVCNNEINLKATKVGMEKKWGFPYLGYGYAWVSEMEGSCGAQITAKLKTTDVGKEKKWTFPYFGFGFSWADKAVLTLTLK